jgi:hypothetical protein
MESLCLPGKWPLKWPLGGTAMSIYRNVRDNPCPIANNDPTVVQLRVPDKGGTFIIFGRLVFTNQDAPAAAAPPQGFTARLTTLNGQTNLDKVEFNVDAGKAVCVFLQGILELKNEEQNDVVDIRCNSAHGEATFAALTALPVQSS